ncbi:MAG: enoyl-CoA hydratase/isomerase family protein [Actinobacteria bacterium]|nr:enoyl-CoA hydratase/isomerase family protein [Actinomycetota bacterium]
MRVVRVVGRHGGVEVHHPFQRVARDGHRRRPLEVVTAGAVIDEPGRAPERHARVVEQVHRPPLEVVARQPREDEPQLLEPKVGITEDPRHHRVVVEPGRRDRRQQVHLFHRCHPYVAHVGHGSPRTSRPHRRQNAAVTFQTLRLDVADGVARLELNRPDAANAINLEVATELRAAAAQLADNASVRAVLLTGAGARFCGGGDVPGFADAGHKLGAQLDEITEQLHPAVETLVGLDAPLVAAVQGSAAGAGLGLVLAADIVLAGESAKFVMAYTGIGLSPDGGSSYFLPRIVGHRRAVELALTNRVLSALEAREWGIVTTVVDDAEVLSSANELVTKLAAGPTRAYGRAARLLAASWDRTLHDQLADESAQLTASGETADGQEGVRAFSEKRPPAFEGR